MPKADFISCRAVPSFRLNLVQAPFRFPIYFRASSVSGPSHPMRTARRLVSFRTQNRPDMQHFVFVRDRKASGLVMNVPAAESGPPDALPQKNSHETCPKPLDSRSAPLTDLHGFKSDFFSEAPLRTPALKTNKKIFSFVARFRAPNHVGTRVYRGACSARIRPRPSGFFRFRPDGHAGHPKRQAAAPYFCLQRSANCDMLALI